MSAMRIDNGLQGHVDTMREVGLEGTEHNPGDILGGAETP